MGFLEIKNISMFFGGIHAIQNVSFEVKKGEILGLIGPNGAGKTTLFNIVNGFYKPSSGDVLFRGHSILKLKPHQICRAGIARTFQISKLLPRMNVFENVLISAYLKAKDKKDAMEITKQILRFTGLYDDQHLISKKLSLDKRKRLEIARALATQPECILLDEFFAGLNPLELDKSMEVVKKISNDGMTVMLIEHHMKVIMSLSDRIIVLNYGEKIAEGSPVQICNNARVCEAYLGETEDA